jgi:hypothetical protein
MKAEDFGDQFRAFTVGEGDGFRFESVAQRLRHSFRIARIAHATFPLLWRNRRQALALLTISPGKGGPTQRDTFTIPQRRRKQRVVSTRGNYCHGALACQAPAGRLVGPGESMFAALHESGFDAGGRRPPLRSRRPPRSAGSRSISRPNDRSTEPASGLGPFGSRSLRQVHRQHTLRPFPRRKLSGLEPCLGLHAAPWQPHQLISGRAPIARTKILHTHGSPTPFLRRVSHAR